MTDTLPDPDAAELTIELARDAEGDLDEATNGVGRDTNVRIVEAVYSEAMCRLGTPNAHLMPDRAQPLTAALVALYAAVHNTAPIGGCDRCDECIECAICRAHDRITDLLAERGVTL